MASLTKKRERVVAEITAAHLIRLANELGQRLTQEEALTFLKESGAYGIWLTMMRAGEAYVKAHFDSGGR